MKDHTIVIHPDMTIRIEEIAAKFGIPAYYATDDLCQLATVAQVLGLPYGRNKLFQKLRQKGVLISGGTRHNLPKQEYVTRGYFSVKESSFRRDEETQVAFTCYATQKGIAWLKKTM